MSNVNPLGLDKTSGQQKFLTAADTLQVSDPAQISSPGSGVNSEKFGKDAVASGTAATAVGEAASATSSSTTAMGKGAIASGTSSTAMGVGASAGAINTIAIGATASAAASGASSLGNETSIVSGATNGTAVGFQANLGSTCTHSVAVGDNAFLNSSAKSIAIGWGAGDTGSTGILGAENNIAIGDGAYVTGKNECIAVGTLAGAGNTQFEHDDIAIGNSATIFGIRNVGIGFGPNIGGGTGLSASHDTVLLGAATGDWGGSFRQSNALIGGSTAFPITDVWFGSGQNSGGSAPTTWSLRGSENWGSVSNKNGGQLNIVAGRGYDSGTGSDIHLQTSNVAGAGAIGASNDVGIFDHLGNARIGLATTTSTSTDGFIYIPAAAGPPTGVPSTFSGFVPMWYDTTNNKLYIYNGGWKTTTVFA